MSRTNLFDQVARSLRIAQYCEKQNISTREALDRIGEASMSRRTFLTAMGAAGAAMSPLAALASPQSGGPRIAIIGGGLSGLVCADRLKAKGYVARVYEASSRLGGRCFSNRTLVPGMVAENGGEFIDTGHKTMLAYANEFNLARESVIRGAGEETFYFAGQKWSEAQIVDQFRAVVATMQPDLRAITGSASFYTNNQADRDLDNTDLASYFAARCADFPLIEAVLNEAYLAEYGLETSEQSTLNFLGFMRLNKQSKFEPFGVSDERFHLINGNDGVVQGLAGKLSGQVTSGARLTRLAKNAAGEFLLYFNGSSVPEKADAVVLTVPFTVLRGIQLDASLGLSADKRRAIDTLGYGNNAKTMVAFTSRYWETQFGASGTTYSDLSNVQTVWETNRANSTSRAILTDYASGVRGSLLRTNQVQTQVNAFLDDLNVVFPGIKARAAKSGSNYVAHLEHWPSNPLSLGSYTCYKPGQFTGIEGLSGEAVGTLKFAGEHADSFYSWQGYMEGACLSGIRAANEVLADIKSGVI